MPIIRKLVEFGTGSRTVTIPKLWLQSIEEKYGKRLLTVALEIDGESVTIHPFFGTEIKTKAVAQQERAKPNSDYSPSRSTSRGDLP